jgi:predicted DNA-binding transcriptional regulator AlpA
MSLLIDAAGGAELLGVSERQFHNLRKREDFPKAVDGLGSRTVRWRVADLQAWVDRLPSAAAVAAEPAQLRRGKASRRQQGPTWAPVPVATKAVAE